MQARTTQPPISVYKDLHPHLAESLRFKKQLPDPCVHLAVEPCLLPAAHVNDGLPACWASRPSACSGVGCGLESVFSLHLLVCVPMSHRPQAPCRFPPVWSSAGELSALLPEPPLGLALSTLYFSVLENPLDSTFHLIFTVLYFWRHCNPTLTRSLCKLSFSS